MVNTAYRSIGQQFDVFESEYGKLTQVSLREWPELDQSLLVMAEDEYATLGLLTPQRLMGLTWLAEDSGNQFQIECGGPCFALRPLLAPANSFTKADPQQMLDGAERLLRLFAS